MMSGDLSKVFLILHDYVLSKGYYTLHAKFIFKFTFSVLVSCLWVKGLLVVVCSHSRHKCQSRDVADGKDMPQVKVP